MVFMWMPHLVEAATQKGMLDCLGECGRVIAFDRDIDAIDYAKSNFKDSRLSLLHANFSKLVDELDSLNLVGKIDRNINGSKVYLHLN